MLCIWEPRRYKQDFNAMSVINQKNEIASYKVIADDKTIVFMKIVDLATNASAEIREISSIGKIPSLRLTNHKGEVVEMECILK